MNERIKNSHTRARFFTLKMANIFVYALGNPSVWDMSIYIQADFCKTFYPSILKTEC